MKAAIVEKPGVLTVREVPPPAVGPYDALCELLYGATCTGTDQHIIHGRFPYPVSYPTILGHESIGRVIEVGAKVRNFRPGDLVTRVGAPPAPDGSLAAHWGGFAELGIARDHRAMRQDGVEAGLWAEFRVNQLLPAGFDPAPSTMIITWRETLSYCTRMGFRSGANVLVMGSGGNGLSFATHAANLGAARVVMTGAAAREQQARAVGATDYFSYRAEDLAGRLRAACPGGFDFAIDAVGKAGLIDLALTVLRPGGTVGIYGIDEHGRCLIDPTTAPTFTFFGGGYDEAETHERVVSFVREGKLRAEHWMDLDNPFPLDRIGEAFDALRRKDLIKALIRLKG